MVVGKDKESPILRVVEYRKQPGRPKGKRNRATEEKRVEDKLERKRVKYASPWDEFREHMRKQALDVGSPAVLKGVYRDMLKLDGQMKKGWEISADEIARRNLVAERELVEGGWIEELT